MKRVENISKIEQWNRGHAVAMIIATVCTLYWGSLDFLVGFAAVSFLVFIVQNRTTLRAIKPFAGYANWVTGFRFLALMGLTFLWSSLPAYTFGIGLIFVVCLDGLDGWLARKYNHATSFGHYFDMELDAWFVLMMCCYYFLFAEIGAWILVPGLLRYVYKIGIDLFPKENFREKKKRYASTIAGIFFVVLLAGLFIGGNIREIGLAIGSALIVFSFGISTVEYIQFKDLSKNTARV